jgi:cytochrome oxidase assembly protein ShyY1
VDRRHLAPRWLAVHAAVLVAVVACGLLGAWQLDRARDQRDQSMQAAGNAALAPVDLDSVLPVGSSIRLDDVGRQVEVTGTYDAQEQLVVPGRELDGQIGSLVLTPLVTADGSAVIVVRGWRSGQPTDPVPAPPSGPVAVSGWLGGSEPAPGNEVMPAGEVGSIHLPTLINLVPYALRDGIIGLSTEDPPAVSAGNLTKLPAPVRIEGGGLPLQNVFYAAEWWVFGVGAIALWISAVRRDDDTIIAVVPPADRYSARS